MLKISLSNRETKGLKKILQLPVHQPTFTGQFELSYRQLSCIFNVMRFFALATVLGLASPVFPYIKTYKLYYDPLYDQKDASLSKVVCSHSEHGLLNHGYKTFGSLPTYPNVGRAPQILPWNLRYCGTCWELTYTNAHGVPCSLNFTAIDAGDHGSDGFSISMEGMDLLTNGHALELHDIPITAVRKPKSVCGL